MPLVTESEANSDQDGKEKGVLFYKTVPFVDEPSADQKSEGIVFDTMGPVVEAADKRNLFGKFGERREEEDQAGIHDNR